MDTNSKIKEIFIAHKAEILQEWKDAIITPNFSFDSTVIAPQVQTLEYLFNFFISDGFSSEEQIKDMEKIIRENHILFPGCIANQFQNRILAENIFIKYARKYHSDTITLEEILWIQDFFKNFSLKFISIVEEVKDEINQQQIQKLKDENLQSIRVLEKISATFVHEFRNPLTVVLGFLQLLKKEQPELPYMNTICFELDQLNDRISQFLALSRKEAVTPVFETVDPKKLCEEIVAFLCRDISDNRIQFSTHFQEGQTIQIDPVKFRQIVINILFNAFDALSEQTEKLIHFTYSIVDNQHVFAISNNGPKISDQIADSIFQPFMSTKELGTGIGLYISKKIITAFRGEISFTSDDQLTTFYIRLPRD